jgi:formylglycine-generating enzyme required for sulfatase activity
MRLLSFSAALRRCPQLRPGSTRAAGRTADAFGPNPFGFHGQHGNVREWCRDAYDDDSRSSVARYRSARGGHYKETAAEARVANRSHYPPQARDESLGLRPARSIEP